MSASEKLQQSLISTPPISPFIITPESTTRRITCKQALGNRREFLPLMLRQRPKGLCTAYHIGSPPQAPFILTVYLK